VARTDAEHAPVAGGGARRRDAGARDEKRRRAAGRQNATASDEAEKGILIVGVDKLLTQLAGCCKPAPPDPIVGFVTRGKGVSVHRADCSNFANMRSDASRAGDRNGLGAAKPTASFAVDIVVEANDRQGLLRDVSDVLTRKSSTSSPSARNPSRGRAHALHRRGRQHQAATRSRTLVCCTPCRAWSGARRA
jgi:GTP pyrophosphokinase